MRENSVEKVLPLEEQSIGTQKRARPLLLGRAQLSKFHFLVVVLVTLYFTKAFLRAEIFKLCLVNLLRSFLSFSRISSNFTLSTLSA